MGGLLLGEKELKRCKRSIERGMKTFVEDSNTGGAVIALSGGLDSSVVLKLSKEADVDVMALIMPEEGITKSEDTKDGLSLVKELGVKHHVIDIGKLVKTVYVEFPWKSFVSDNKKIALGNVRARTRMILSYIVANLDDRVVFGTGNKTEILLGYGTKYGDTAVDFQPIGGLYKTQVYQLADYIGIPDSITKKAPSAGLWKDQTDEAELGLDYETIDNILYNLVENNLPMEETSRRLGIDPEIVKGIHGRIGENEHKRKLPLVIELF